MSELISWLGSEEVKAKYLAQITAHEKADEIVKGCYWEDGKGCAVGCLLHENEGEHELFESYMGIPEWCARLIDALFENLPNDKAKLFPRQFVEAVPIGKSKAWWNQVKWKFCAFLMKENIERVLKLDINDDLKKQVVDAVRGALAVHEAACESGKWDESAARSAELAAESAAESARSAESAVWSAARSARSAESAVWSAESAVWSAARSAESAVWSAARSAESAAESAVWSAAWSARLAAFKRYAEEFLRLLKEQDK